MFYFLHTLAHHVDISTLIIWSISAVGRYAAAGHSTPAVVDRAFHVGMVRPRVLSIGLRLAIQEYGGVGLSGLKLCTAWTLWALVLSEYKHILIAQYPDVLSNQMD